MLPCSERWKVQISADLPVSDDPLTIWHSELASPLAFIERSHKAIWHLMSTNEVAALPITYVERSHNAVRYGIDFDDCLSNALQWPE